MDKESMKMPRVHVLDKELAELIAAGEVIERPSSVIKELVENSIDSGASSVTVEIKRGGISYIRITDNGCGISHPDVPTAFLRHATSKLNMKDDLSRILTLGFRGEALASVCAVARCEVITKPKEDELGTHYMIEGTEEKLYEKTGCPDGTTIIVRDLFYNVPARLKFLKQDKYEGNAIASIIGKIAVSHPEISFRFIRENRQELFTPGDSRLYSAVYSVFGKEFAAALIPAAYKMGGISVNGYTVKPLWGRKNRTMQHFFVNGRYIRSLTCMGALEEAYRNSIMEGKYPACVLFLDIPPSMVDVNVHPAKTEVRFSNDKAIYDAVFFAVKNALLADTKPAEIHIPQHKPTQADYAMPMFTDTPAEQTVIKDTSVSKYNGSVSVQTQTPVHESVQTVPAREVAPYQHSAELDRVAAAPEVVHIEQPAKKEPVPEAVAETTSPKNTVTQEKTSDISEHLQSGYGNTDNESIDNLRGTESPDRKFKFIDDKSFKKREETGETVSAPKEKPKEPEFFRIIGEAFRNYAIAETEDGILIVDKHAAHERIRFERLRTGREDLTAQMLLVPEKVMLDYGEYDAIVKNLEICSDHGFEIEPLQAPAVLVKGIPSMLDKNDAGDIVTELAQNFAAHRHDPLPELLDDMYHTIACRGAIKANDVTGVDELKSLVSQILSDDRIRYCPHGRPVMFKLTKKELEKQFKRIV
ncbi:MAG: DNA mismatch repair endonuclease MutL [Huintestinicola sp.]